MYLSPLSAYPLCPLLAASTGLYPCSLTSLTAESLNSRVYFRLPMFAPLDSHYAALPSARETWASPQARSCSTPLHPNRLPARRAGELRPGVLGDLVCLRLVPAARTAINDGRRKATVAI